MVIRYGNVPMIIHYIVHYRLDYVEEYIHYKDRWEVNITPGYDVRKIKLHLIELTNLKSSDLDVHEYESCGSGFEKHGLTKNSEPSGKETNKPDNCNAVNTKRKTATVSYDNTSALNISSEISAAENISESKDGRRFDSLERQANPCYDSPGNSPRESASTDSAGKQIFNLPIGDKIFYQRMGNVYNQVTLGSFVKVVTNDNQVLVCAQTSCEGATIGTPCYVSRNDITVNSQKFVQFGDVKYVLEEKDLDGISHDIMLIHITEDNFKPRFSVFAKGNNQQEKQCELALYSGKISEVSVKYAVKKLVSNYVEDGLVDGIVMYPDISRKDKYLGMVGLSTIGHPPKKMTQKGDCGMLMTGMPQDGKIRALGTVYGADSRKDKDTGENVRFTVISPIPDAFTALKKKYQLQELKFLNSDSEIGETLQEDIAVTDYYEDSMISGDMFSTSLPSNNFQSEIYAINNSEELNQMSHGATVKSDNNDHLILSGEDSALTTDISNEHNFKPDSSSSPIKGATGAIHTAPLHALLADLSVVEDETVAGTDMNQSSGEPKMAPLPSMGESGYGTDVMHSP